MARSERVARYWDKLADLYDENELLAGATYPAIVESIKDEFTPMDRLLEVGAGTGILTVEVALLVQHVTCTDIAPEMVERARAKLAQFEHVDYRVEDAAGLSLEDGSFDVVLCCNVLHQMANPGLAVEEFHRVLRPGGKLLAITITQGDMSLWGKVRMGVEYFFRFGIPPEMHTFRLSSFRRLISDAGFDVLKSALVARDPLPTAYVAARKP